MTNPVRPLTAINDTIVSFRAFLATPAGATYLRRRFVPYEYVRLVEWLRARAPFDHSGGVS